jgi:membrane-associated protease RseP (regulator of RpoE activity)
MSDKKNLGRGLKPIENRTKRTAVIILIFVIGFLGIYAAYVSSFLSLINQILLAVIILVLTGNLIRFYSGSQGWNFLYMFSTKSGITTIDNISKKYQGFWEALSLWGIVVGLGLLSYPFLKGKISKKLYIFGIISLYLILVFIFPFTIYGVQLISVSQIQSLVQNAVPNVSLVPQTFYAAILYVIAIIAGFSGFIVAALFLSAYNILLGIGQFILTIVAGHPQTTTLTNQIPGVIPVIPGITIPLVAGLISLLILLVVHEGSHGVLARIAKVKLKSVGLLMIGVIPVGAVVEPDEKQVTKLDSLAQTKIFAAGSSMNFLVSAVFFVLMLLFLTYVTPNLHANIVLIQAVVPNTPAYNVLLPGMQILRWDGYPIQNLSSFVVADANVTGNSIVTVVTNTSTYSIKAAAVPNTTHGEIGIEVYQPLKTDPISSLEYFIYPILALSLALNLFLAIFNLLPIPMFDGWRIYKSNIKNEKFVRALAYILVALILINVISTLLVVLL